MLQHESYHETPMKDYYDGREQPVLDKYARMPTAEEITAAKVAADLERKTLPFRPRPVAALPMEFPSEEDFEALAAQDGLYNLIRKYGGQRVMTWVRNLSAIAGQEVR